MGALPPQEVETHTIVTFGEPLWRPLHPKMQKITERARFRDFRDSHAFQRILPKLTVLRKCRLGGETRLPNALRAARLARESTATARLAIAQAQLAQAMIQAAEAVRVERDAGTLLETTEEATGGLQ